MKEIQVRGNWSKLVGMVITLQLVVQARVL